MESGSYTDLAFSIFLGLSVVLGIGLLVDAAARWLLARSLWAQIIARENLDDNNAWSRVKVWAEQPGLLRRPEYALMYADRECIRIESCWPINQQLITTLDRMACASHWRDDCVEFKTEQGKIRIRAIGAGIPVSSIQQTDQFWQQLQPDTADPFDNGVRQLESCADRRSKLALLVLSMVALVALVEILFLDSFWVLSGDPYTRFWWIPVFAAMPIAITMTRDLVPPVEAVAAALMLATGFTIGGHIGLKRVDQWVSSPQSQLYVLRMNGGRELAPMSARGPAIKLHSASPVWDDIALGSRHAVVIYGGTLGTMQINYDQLLPDTLALLTN